MSIMSQVASWRPKFNHVLNDAVAKFDPRILTINSCSTFEHFEKKGALSQKGKEEFWMELDDLIQRFDVNKVKLLPNPKNPPRVRELDAQQRNDPHSSYNYPKMFNRCGGQQQYHGYHHYDRFQRY